MSYHPVDVDLIRKRVLPYVLGAGPDSALDDLITHGMRIRRIRWRAKAWALGTRAHLTGDDPLRFVWGRPLFSTSARADTVAEDTLRYLSMGADTEVVPIARTMAARVAPMTVVQPDEPSSFPGTDESLRAEIGGQIHLLRVAVAALRADRSKIDGVKDATPAKYVAAQALWDVVRFASTLVPGWMDRGTVWPTLLAANADLPAPPGFSSPEALMAPLVAEFPDLNWKFEDTIIENYMVGGYVAPADVPVLRQWFADHRGRILTHNDYAGLALDKLDEALALAARLGFGFCEATEIYSGLGGRIN